MYRIGPNMDYSKCFTAFYIVIKSKLFPYFQWISFSGCLVRVDTCNFVIPSHLNIIYAKYFPCLSHLYLIVFSSAQIAGHHAESKCMPDI